jgi:hypothetical protein
MGLFNVRPVTAAPLKRIRLKQADDLPQEPQDPYPNVPQDEPGVIKFVHDRRQPKKGPLHWQCPWCMIGVDVLGVAQFIRFPLLSADTPLDEVMEHAHRKNQATGLLRMRVIDLNRCDLQR